jgi:uncharacterized CHY-type Zn-finger protein
MQSETETEKCEAEAIRGVPPNTAGAPLRWHADVVSLRRAQVTITLRCLNCGFSFTVTALTTDPADEATRPVACGHCRSSHWSSQLG